MDSYDNVNAWKAVQKKAADGYASESGQTPSSRVKKMPEVTPSDDLCYDYSSETGRSGKSERIDVFMSRERRTYPRRHCFLSVNYATEERAYQEFIQDISASGAFIETRCALPVGQNIAMTFSLPGKQESVRLSGSVTRNTSSGIGVAFVLHTLEQKNYLSSHIGEL